MSLLQGNTVTEEIINSLPEFNTWLASLKGLSAEEIAEIAEVDSEELVDMLKYHLFRVYNQEVQDEAT